MPDPSTPRLSLYKSKSDGSELVNYTQDLGQNWDKVDLAVGMLACTSTTRPSAPFNGQQIRETDTGRTWVSNGSAPASGSWLELPNLTGTASGTLRLDAASSISFGGATANTALALLYGANQNWVSLRLTGDTQSRLLADMNGKLTWGPGGSTAGDTNIYRGAANQLKTDDDFVAVGNLTAANFTSTAEVAYTPVWSGTGVSLGNGTIAGSYVKFGKLVTCFGEIVMGTTTNTGSGVWSITAPFTAATGPATSSANWGYAGSVRGHGAKWYAGTAAVLNGTNTIRFYQDQGATEWSASVPTAWSSASTSYMHWCVSYMTP